MSSGPACPRSASLSASVPQLARYVGIFLSLNVSPLSLAMKHPAGQVPCIRRSLTGQSSLRLPDACYNPSRFTCQPEMEQGGVQKERPRRSPPRAVFCRFCAAVSRAVTHLSAKPSSTCRRSRAGVWREFACMARVRHWQTHSRGIAAAPVEAE